MPIIGWVSIIIAAVCGVTIPLVIWFLNRKTRRADALEEEVFGRKGLRADIAELRSEGRSREDKILSALNDQTRALGGQMRDLRDEITGEHVRLKIETERQVDEVRKDSRDAHRRIDGLSRSRVP